MKSSKLTEFTTRYLASLKTHWEKGPLLGLAAAHSLGLEAVVLGLETLKIAAIHKQAVGHLTDATWKPEKRDVMTSRATLFYNEVIAHVEKSHANSLKSMASVKKANSALKWRTHQLTASTSALKTGITNRKGLNRQPKVSHHHSTRLLNKTAELEQQLHAVAQRIFDSTEAQRKEISLSLHEEISQTLLGIHVRLLTLKKEVRASQTGFGRDIAGTQRLVALSVETIKRFAAEFARPHET